MKRKLIIASLIAALAAPAVAWASLRSFAGRVEPDGHIAFAAKINATTHKAVRIKRGLTFRRVRIHCDQGPRKIKGKFHTGIPVRRRHFTATGTYQGGGKVTVEGEFRHHAHRARGTIEVSGDFTLPDPNLTGCHGLHDWRART